VNGRAAPVHAKGASLAAAAARAARGPEAAGAAARAGTESSLLGSLLEALATAGGINDEDLGAVDGDAADTAGLLGLLQAMSDKLSDSLKAELASAEALAGASPPTASDGQDGPYASGLFEVSGTYDPWAQDDARVLRVEVLPRRWLRKPGKGWVMVGLSGTLTRGAKESPAGGKTSKPPSKVGTPTELRAMLVNEDGDQLAGCTQLIAHRAPESEPANADSWDGLLMDSVWKGTYSCAGLSTELVLRLNRHPQGSAVLLPIGELRGTFEFLVPTGHAKDAQRQHDAREEGSSPKDLRGLVLRARRKVTEAGCECRDVWKYATKDSSGKKVTYDFRGTVCANPDGLRDREFCMIDAKTCDRTPAGSNWDYCFADWRERQQNIVLQRHHINLDGGISVVRTDEQVLTAEEIELILNSPDLAAQQPAQNQQVKAKSGGSFGLVANQVEDSASQAQAKDQADKALTGTAQSSSERTATRGKVEPLGTRSGRGDPANVDVGDTDLVDGEDDYDEDDDEDGDGDEYDEGDDEDNIDGNGHLMEHDTKSEFGKGADGDTDDELEFSPDDV